MLGDGLRNAADGSIATTSIRAARQLHEPWTIRRRRRRCCRACRPRRAVPRCRGRRKRGQGLNRRQDPPSTRNQRTDRYRCWSIPSRHDWHVVDDHAHYAMALIAASRRVLEPDRRARPGESGRPSPKRFDPALVLAGTAKSQLVARPHKNEFGLFVLPQPQGAPTDELENAIGVTVTSAFGGELGAPSLVVGPGLHAILSTPVPDAKLDGDGQVSACERDVDRPAALARDRPGDSVRQPSAEQKRSERQHTCGVSTARGHRHRYRRQPAHVTRSLLAHPRS